MMDTPEGVNRDFALLLERVAVIEQSTKRIEDRWNDDRERQEQDHKLLADKVDSLCNDFSCLRKEVCVSRKDRENSIPNRWIFGVASAILILQAGDEISVDLITAVISTLTG